VRNSSSPLFWAVNSVNVQVNTSHVCVCVCVCVCDDVGRQGSLALAGSLSRRRKTLIQNQGSRSPLASPCDGRTHQSSRIFPAIGFWVRSLETVGRRGATSSHVKNLTAQTWQSTRGWSLGIDPTASTAMHSSFIEVPSTSLQVCDDLLEEKVPQLGLQITEIWHNNDGNRYFCGNFA